MNKNLRILHTSDWHIGKKLKEKDRSEEFTQFFEWLNRIIADEKIDALIVSGDIFDNKNPSAESQHLYYSFLASLSESPCRHTVIISGNHDSPSFIDAPSEIMRHCNIYVTGRPCSSPSDEVITLTDTNGNPQLIVCAVPYLHDRYIRTVKDDDIPDDTELRIKAGIMNHYAQAITHAKNLRGDSNIPLVAMGHLFLEKGKTLNGEGEHSLYLGTAVKVGTDIFPKDLIAYTALGHLHSPQKIGRDDIRYSGSPIAMTFGELDVPKSVSVVDFEGRNLAGVKEIPIPVFRKMKRVQGNMHEIETALRQLGELNESVWVEVTYTGTEAPGDINRQLTDVLNEFPSVEILSVIDEGRYLNDTIVHDGFGGKTLSDIEPEKMFALIMESKGVPDDRRERMKELYREILHNIQTGGSSE